MMADRRTTVLLSVLLFASAAAFVEELDDSFMETKGDDEIWLIKFYAPWCTFCKQLDPVWHQIGSELRSLGSPVHIGKSDATANTGLAKEFRVRTYPAILMLKKNIKYNYSGARTKEGIMDFANRIAGPLVRSLSSVQLFHHAMSRHDVMFVYVGATSPLKGNYTSVAEQLIVHTYFFSASRDVLPKAVSLSTLPAVVVFKDGTYFTYSEERDGDLKLWINRERFPNFSQIDSYTLYAMGETDPSVHGVSCQGDVHLNNNETGSRRVCLGQSTEMPGFHSLVADWLRCSDSASVLQVSWCCWRWWRRSTCVKKVSGIRVCWKMWLQSTERATAGTCTLASWPALITSAAW
ncbi:protein disulfide-isomerase tmx3a-like isoform X4 [Pelmatolapia mariae]|uniref:protein disulfide-isomerase tmx3a-like isoform X4 n=1 Tax=Pelmatolapia mariae TaxID=158779 RepID=UPI002FE56864